MVDPQMVRVLQRSAFHDTALTSSGDLSYLGGEVSLFLILFLSMYFTDTTHLIFTKHALF